MDERIKGFYLKISNKITCKMAMRVSMTEDDIIIFTYHLRCILCESLRFFIMMIISAIAGRLGDFIFAYIAMRIIRSTTGGLHHKSYLMCSLHSYLFFLTIIVVDSYVELSDMIFIFPLSIACILVFGPAPSKERGSYGKKSRRRLKIIGAFSVICCWILTMIMPAYANIITYTFDIIIIHGVYA